MSTDLHNRRYLYSRHRLSHRQIDRMLHETESKASLSEKLLQLKAVQQFIRATDQLRNAHIPFVCFKGPLLSFRIYGDATVRRSNDMDLLIHATDMEAILQQLYALGYQLAEGVFWPEKIKQQQLLLQSVQHIALAHPAEGSIIELHWKLSKGFSLPECKVEDLINAHLTQMEYAGRSFTVFTKEFELLYLLMHGAKHGWFRLKWLADIRDYPLSEIDTAQFYSLVEAFSAQRIVLQTRVLLQAYFQHALPFSAKTRVRACFIAFARKEIENPAVEQHSLLHQIELYRYNWYLFPTLHYKKEWCKSLLFRTGDLAALQGSSRVHLLLFRLYSFAKRRIFTKRA